MLFDEEEKCELHLRSIGKLVYDGALDATIGCNGTFDKVMCWPAVAANTTLQVPCPSFKGVFDTNKFLHKRCLEDATWEGFNRTNRPSGFTNFATCYTDEALKEFAKIKESHNTGLVYHIASYIELSGLLLSLVCICLSLFIFFYHKNLRCQRTRIHLNLFVAILCQSMVRIVFFVDRFLYKANKTPSQISFESQFMLYNKAICPALISFLEYFQLCGFMWMLCEGVYLNILLMYSFAFEERMRHAVVVFYVIGWGLPAGITLAWSLTLLYTIGIDDVCWSGYYQRNSYWIIQAPILAILIINFLCLANVIRVLAVKLKRISESNQNESEVDQIKKSVKAALLLLPLLGITHMFELYHDEPKNWIVNLLLSIINAFLVFYQGVFLSFLYCFCNNEVKEAVFRKWLVKCKFFNSMRRSPSSADATSSATTNPNQNNNNNNSNKAKSPSKSILKTKTKSPSMAIDSVCVDSSVMQNLMAAHNKDNQDPIV